jgi:hypothetical protein
MTITMNIPLLTERGALRGTPAINILLLRSKGRCVQIDRCRFNGFPSNPESYQENRRNGFREYCGLDRAEARCE